LVEAVRLLRGDFHGIGLYVVGDDLSHPPLRVSRILEKDWILWEKSLPEPELPIFYSSCDAFAFLSEYEGFGFPPLEALACGTVPVLLNRGSLGEVFRDTAVFVDKLDVRDILSALKCALSDEPAREAIRNNFERARHGFSWERAADEYALLVKENV
jgi:glycosyltransferase involved in cell wall biosynthesis